MRLFLKDHRLLIGLQTLQIAFLFIVLWLDGYRNVRMFFYVSFIYILFLSVFLVYRFITKRSFYERLVQPFALLDESLQLDGRESMTEALSKLLKSQYRVYEQNIHETKVKTEEHLMFIERWVHQMKTPLSVIELTAQGLDEPVSSDIREETERMKTGLHTILYMARLRSIEQDFRIEPVVLEQIVLDVNRDHKRFFIRNQVYPKLDVKRKNMTVETDKKWLKFIVSQLLQNAVTYSAGKSEHVNISLYEREGAAICEVKDFGVGIPKEDLRRVFHAFYTGENGRHYRESTGMGLYLVKEVIDYLEHQIEIESVAGQGAVFRIIFPPAQNLTAL